VKSLLEIEEAIARLPATARRQLVLDIPALCPGEFPADGWDAILNNTTQRPALSTLLDQLDAEHATSSKNFASSLRCRVEELADLKPGWDGETAKPINIPVMTDVVEYLRHWVQLANPFHEPFLAPTFDGSVQIEWHDEQRSLEMEAVDSGWAVIGGLTGRDAKRQYFEGECERGDFDQLDKFYKWFVGRELTWPSR
jgi:hypothetical protein